MLWIVILFRILSLLFSSCFRNRESLLFLNSIPSTTSRSHILLRETVAIISYPTSIERNRQQTERASIWRFTRFSRNVLFVKWSQNKTQPCVLFADEITKRWNGLCSSYSVTNSMISISIHVHDKNAQCPCLYYTTHSSSAIPIELCEGQFGSLSHQSTPKRRDSQHDNQQLLVNRCWHLVGVLSSFPLLICSRSVWDHSLLAVFSPRHRQASHRCSCLWGVVHQ